MRPDPASIYDTIQRCPKGFHLIPCMTCGKPTPVPPNYEGNSRCSRCMSAIWGEEKTMSENEARKDWDERKGYSDDDSEPMTLMDWLKFLLAVGAGTLLIWCVWWMAYEFKHPVVPR